MKHGSIRCFGHSKKSMKGKSKREINLLSEIILLEKWITTNMTTADKPIGFLKGLILWRGKETVVIEPYYHPLEIPKAKIRLAAKCIEVLKRQEQERTYNDNGNS